MSEMISVESECVICGQPGYTCKDLDTCVHKPEYIQLNSKAADPAPVQRPESKDDMFGWFVVYTGILEHLLTLGDMPEPVDGEGPELVTQEAVRWIDAAVSQALLKGYALGIEASKRSNADVPAVAFCRHRTTMTLGREEYGCSEPCDQCKEAMSVALASMVVPSVPLKLHSDKPNLSDWKEQDLVEALIAEGLMPRPSGEE